jgi:hypothetical protein
MTVRSILRAIGVLAILSAPFALAQATSTMRVPIAPIGTPLPFFGMLSFGALDNIPNAPFCASVQTGRTQNLVDGNRIELHRAERVCRDSKGRTRREMDPPPTADLTNRGPIVMTTIFDPVANVSYTLNERRHSAWKHPIRINTAMRPAMQPSANHRTFINGREVRPSDVTEEDLGESSVNGYVAKGTRITRIVPSGEMGNDQPMTIVIERWYSEELKTVVRIKQVDPRIGEAITELTNISATEPDPSLFQVPADYTIEDPPGLRIAPTPPPPNPQ